ncbi:MAG: M23 family metallopeptidase [Actinobacteria bacterium]|nr:M23 family metallopeptidase [Actinomycetota bacterium]
MIDPGAGGQPELDEGPDNTARLIALLDGLAGTDVSLEEALLQVVGPFPVAGLAWWSDDWHAYRCCPDPHLHQGIDIFAAAGTPAVASADGVVSQKVDDPDSSGLAIEITDDAGTEYFYAHFMGFAEGLDLGDRVEVGEILGYIGNTGNASATAPHLHFEVQPDGVPVPPLPYLTSWLLTAETRAADLVEELTGIRPVVDPSTLRFWLTNISTQDIVAILAAASQEIIPLDAPLAPVTSDPGRSSGEGGTPSSRLGPNGEPRGYGGKLPPVDDLAPVTALVLSCGALVILAAASERRRTLVAEQARLGGEEPRERERRTGPKIRIPAVFRVPAVAAGAVRRSAQARLRQAFQAVRHIGASLWG